MGFNWRQKKRGGGGGNLTNELWYVRMLECLNICSNYDQVQYPQYVGS